jgi:hypothetical protein
MWNENTEVMPLIIETAGTISKSLRKTCATVVARKTSRNYRKRTLRT